MQTDVLSIIAATAEETSVSPDAIAGRNGGGADVRRAKRLCWLLIRRTTGLTYREIAKEFDMTVAPVHKGAQAAQALIEDFPAEKRKFDRCLAVLNSA